MAQQQSKAQREIEPRYQDVYRDPEWLTKLNRLKKSQITALKTELGLNKAEATPLQQTVIKVLK